MKNLFKYLLAAFLYSTAFIVLIPVASCNDNKPVVEDPAVIEDLTVEQLCDVATNPDMDEIILHYEGFTVSFNPTMHLPNWVAWTITREKMDNSTLPRQDNFRPDNNVNGCATLADYYKSGFERGHMAPSGDMKWSAKAMDDACLLTNICPQLHELNNGAWKNLEERCRKNATRDELLIVICGPVLTQGFKQHIGETPLPVPPSYFKVILTPESATGPQAIGFIMPNGYVEGGMQAAAVSVDEVEKITGHDFFHALPDELETLLEADNDFNRFSTGRRSKRSLQF